MEKYTEKQLKELSKYFAVTLLAVQQEWIQLDGHTIDETILTRESILKDLKSGGIQKSVRQYDEVVNINLN